MINSRKWTAVSQCIDYYIIVVILSPAPCLVNIQFTYFHVTYLGMKHQHDISVELSLHNLFLLNFGKSIMVFQEVAFKHTQYVHLLNIEVLKEE